MSTAIRSHLDVSAGVDLVNRVSGSSSSLSVQVVALHKHGVVAQTAHPHVSLAFALQLHSFADMEPEDREEAGGETGEVRIKTLEWNVMIYT